MTMMMMMCSDWTDVDDGPYVQTGASAGRPPSVRGHHQREAHARQVAACVRSHRASVRRRDPSPGGQSVPVDRRLASRHLTGDDHADRRPSHRTRSGCVLRPARRRTLRASSR